MKIVREVKAWSLTCIVGQLLLVACATSTFAAKLRLSSHPSTSRGRISSISQSIPVRTVAAVNTVVAVGAIPTPGSVVTVGAIATVIAIGTVCAIPIAIASGVCAIPVAFPGVASANRRNYLSTERL